MDSLRLIYVILILLVANCQTFSNLKDKPSFQTTYNELYHSEITEARELAYEFLNDYPGVSISVAKKGEVIWTEAFGFADIKANKPVTPNHLFRIYSLTKPMTGTLAARLWEDQKLNVYKRVGDYIPDLPDHIQEITVLQLLNHSSGIRHYKKGEWMKISHNDCGQVMEALDVFINDPLIAKPGESYHYSSFNYVLLSAILEKAGKDTFDRLMLDYIFKPSGMTDIYLDEPNNNRDSLVAFYESKSKLAKIINNSCKWGGGGYNATAESLVNFGKTLIQGKLLGKDAFNLMISDNKLNSGESYNYGFGIGIFKLEVDHGLCLSHSGSGLGGAGMLQIYPQEQLVIAILGNNGSKAIKNNMNKFSSIFLN